MLLTKLQELNVILESMICSFFSQIMIGVGLGVLHVFPVEIDKKLNLVPVDYVNNAIIAATWDTCERRKHGALKEIPMYTVSSSKRSIVWGKYSLK